MNKNRQTTNNKAIKPKKQPLKAKKPQTLKTPKRNLSSSITNNNSPKSLSNLSTPILLPSQQKRSLMTKQTMKPLNTPSNQFPFPSPLPSTIPSFAPSQKFNNTMFTLAKRGLILKPKAPLDPNQDLLFEFNILKEAKPIVELPDSEYPDWLWTVADPQQSLYDISKIPEAEMNITTMRRKFKLDRRELIRNNNNATRK